MKWFDDLMGKFGYTKVKPKGRPGRKPRDPNAPKTVRSVKRAGGKKHQIPPQPSPAPTTAGTAPTIALAKDTGFDANWPFPNSGGSNV